MYLHEYLGGMRFLAGATAVELLHLVSICTNIFAQGAFLQARRPWSCGIWSVSARVSWRETPSCGRGGRGGVPFGMYLHEYLDARHFLLGAKAVELLRLV